jgi:hypothetical protein
VTWGDPFGQYFDQTYRRVTDPGCPVAPPGSTDTYYNLCQNTALADANGNIVLRNAAPGQLGTLGLNPLYGPGRWEVDANIQKTFKTSESTRVTVRVDANNVFNHPNPGSPNLNINTGTFGEIDEKTGFRSLAAQVRLEF